jgi:hypothetical protein
VEWEAVEWEAVEWMVAEKTFLRSGWGVPSVSLSRTVFTRV